MSWSAGQETSNWLNDVHDVGMASSPLSRDRNAASRQTGQTLRPDDQHHNTCLPSWDGKHLLAPAAGPSASLWPLGRVPAMGEARPARPARSARLTITSGLNESEVPAAEV